MGGLGVVVGDLMKKMWRVLAAADKHQYSEYQELRTHCAERASVLSH